MAKEIDNEEVASPNSISCKPGFWKKILITSLSVGVLTGIVEVCWIYLLPVLFPERRYVLPIPTFYRFILVAVILDTILVILGGALAGLALTLLRRMSAWLRDPHNLTHAIRFIVIAAPAAYLYRGHLYIYLTFASEPLRFCTAVAGVAAILVLTWLLVILVAKLQRHSKKNVAAIMWTAALVIFATVTTFNYARYKKSNLRECDLPTNITNENINVVLITIDTLRADRLGCYGNRVVQTPALDALAADAVVFTNAFSQAPYTTPSHCSIMTSTYPRRHGALNGSAMTATVPTLAEILRANGYKTGAFVSAAIVISKNSGLHHGFDHYDDSLSRYTDILRHDEYQFLLAGNTFMHLHGEQIRGDVVTDKAVRWLKDTDGGPFFAWLHYFDPHTPYDAPEPYKDMYRDKSSQSRYDGEVTYADHQLGRFIDALKKRGLYDHALVIVTADHGEAFGEKHGDIVERGHGRYLYDTTQHVPLIVKLPDRSNNLEIEHVVGLIDIAPTIVDYLGLEMPQSFQGKSALDLLNSVSRTQPGQAFSERMPNAVELSLMSKAKTEDQILMAIRTKHTKYIRNVSGAGAELYLSREDPAESTNVLAQHPELAQACYDKIQAALGRTIEIPALQVDSRVLEQLRALGYVGEDTRQDGKD